MLLKHIGYRLRKKPHVVEGYLWNLNKLHSPNVSPEWESHGLQWCKASCCSEI